MKRLFRAGGLLAAGAFAIGLVAGCDQGAEMTSEPELVSCPHLIANGFVIASDDGAADETTLVQQWGTDLNGGLATPAGATVDSLRITFFDPDSVAYAPQAECAASYTLLWNVADTTICDISLVPDGTFWHFDLHGKRDGTTTVTFRPRHESHSHFITMAIPIVVGTGVSETPSPVSGVLVRNGPSIVTGYNTDPVGAPGQTFGAIVVEVGLETQPLTVGLVDSLGTPFVPEAGDSIVFELGDSTGAAIEPVGGDPAGFRILGPPAWEEETTLRVKLLRGAATVFVSAGMPVIIDDQDRIMASASFELVRDDTTEVLVQDGVAISSCGTIAVSSGRLHANAGLLGDVYQFRVFYPIAPCVPEDPDVSQHHLAFEFADPSLVEVVRYPQVPGDPLKFQLRGIAAGSTTVRIWFLHMGHVIFECVPIEVEVES